MNSGINRTDVEGLVACVTGCNLRKQVMLHLLPAPFALASDREMRNIVSQAGSVLLDGPRRVARNIPSRGKSYASLSAHCGPFPLPA